MSIEISQVITHILGFLITVWLLKRFAWRPLLHMMDERRQKIKDEFQHIDEEKAKAAQLLTEYEERIRGIELERRQKIADAIAEGHKIASEIKTDAQEEARGIVTRTSEQLQRDVEKAKVQLKEDMVNITMAAAERILHEKVDQKKERELIDKFIDGIEKA